MNIFKKFIYHQKAQKIVVVSMAAITNHKEMMATSSLTWLVFLLSRFTLLSGVIPLIYHYWQIVDLVIVLWWSTSHVKVFLHRSCFDMDGFFYRLIYLSPMLTNYILIRVADMTRIITQYVIKDLVLWVCTSQCRMSQCYTSQCLSHRALLSVIVLSIKVFRLTWLYVCVFTVTVLRVTAFRVTVLHARGIIFTVIRVTMFVSSHFSLCQIVPCSRVAFCWVAAS